MSRLEGAKSGLLGKPSKLDEVSSKAEEFKDDVRIASVDESDANEESPEYSSEVEVDVEMEPRVEFEYEVENRV